MADATPYQQPLRPGVRPPAWRHAALAVGGVLLVLTLLALAVGSLGGAGSGGDGEAMTAGDGGMSAGGSDAVETAEDVAGRQVGEQAVDVDAALRTRAVIRTGALTLTDPDVADARHQVIAAVRALGGYVADEQSRADEDGDLRLTDLTLQVPTAEFETAMERFGAAGTVIGRTQSERDVTEQVVDVDTRVASAESSLRRIRILLGRAVSLGDVIRLEQVLSSRQADLESLMAQQESLAARTDLASVQVTISTPTRSAVEVETDDATGFLAGLGRGWDALTSGYVALATLLGTVLPTLAVLGGLTLLARWSVRRFRRTSRTADVVA
jgi:hypothetical protein